MVLSEEKKSNQTIKCEEQSLYRALRKYEHINVLSYELKTGNKGPDRKYYFSAFLSYGIDNQNTNIVFLSAIMYFISMYFLGWHFGK